MNKKEYNDYSIGFTDGFCAGYQRGLKEAAAENADSKSADGADTKVPPSFPSTAFAPDCLSSADRADAAIPQQSQPETITPLTKELGQVIMRKTGRCPICGELSQA